MGPAAARRALAITLLGMVSLLTPGAGIAGVQTPPDSPPPPTENLPPRPPPDADPGALKSSPVPGLPRSTVDRVDDTQLSQVHVMYVLPSDGIDRGLDTDGHLAGSMHAINAWLAANTPGREFRIDTYQGAVDVTFFQLDRTDAIVRSGAEFPGPAFVRDIIEKDMKAAGFDKPNTLYAVFYDGHSDWSCGGGAFPPKLPGTVGAMYLLGLPDAAVTCASQPLPGADPSAPWYFDFGMAHELIHTLGFVPACAPNQGSEAHVPEPSDLMYGGGTDFWDLSHLVLDIGRDDYYQHSNAGCLDLDDSPFLKRSIDANADFDGNGTTDVAVFRPSSGTWYRNSAATTSFGLPGDIPVPCDYDGDGTTDIAVFRPSVGGWYVKDQAPVFFGLLGDVPVPADYNGDTRCEIAVFRPSVGGWYVQGQSPQFYGLDGDIPVPADYAGHGRAEIAVFRPSVGGWYRNGAPSMFFGLNGDIPVPGDYIGDGTAQVAIYRPAVGGWYVQGLDPHFLGLAGDIPVPGDYDGNITTDGAVFRPSIGAWYGVGGSPVFFGASGDFPLPLPAAIRMAAFPT